VLAFPTSSSHARERTLHLSGPRYGPKLAFVNAHVRTIARVIVHPQFRSLGVAARLVRRICEDCPTRYVEAFAAMGEVHPFFERGGMRRVETLDEGEAAYFICDREGGGRCGE
jgi:ABC-type ATPase with predicted acetyltransferase domain